MRPAQRKLARALPKPQQHLRMRQATVVQGTSTTVTTPGGPPAVRYSDSFNRADGPLGSTDGGLGSPTPWLPEGTAWGITGDAAGLVTPVLAAASSTYAVVDCASPGGTYAVTLAEVPALGVNAAWGLGFRYGDGAGGVGSPAALYAGVVGIKQYPDGHYGQWIGYTTGTGIASASDTGPFPAVGDRLTVIDSPGSVSYLVNGVHLPGSPQTANWTSYFGPDGQQQRAGLYVAQDPSLDPSTGLMKDFSYTPLTGPSGTTTTVASDVEVDFGDGVPVACPRASNCPALVVGDVVLVLRQDHSNVVVDKITPLGDS